MSRISQQEAIKTAQKYAKQHGYSNVELRSTNYVYADVIPTFAFYLQSDDDQNVIPNPTGLPEVVLIEKTFGKVITDRALL